VARNLLQPAFLVQELAEHLKLERGGVRGLWRGRNRLSSP